MHRWVARAHLGQHFLGRDAPVHHPHPIRFAVLRLDLGQEAAQGVLVGRVARQDLVGQREAFRGHHQSDDHLDTVAALVPAVAEAALVVLVLRWVTLKVGACQVVAQHVKARVKKVLPTRLQVGEKRGLMRQELVVTGVELVGLGQGEVAPEQIGQRAALKPLAVQAPFAARIDEAVEAEGLEDQIPARALAIGGQTFGKEGIQPELFIEVAGEPARAPLARAAQLQPGELDAHHRPLAVLRPLGAAFIGVQAVVGQEGDGFGSGVAVLETSMLFCQACCWPSLISPR